MTKNFNNKDFYNHIKEQSVIKKSLKTINGKIESDVVEKKTIFGEIKKFIIYYRSMGVNMELRRNIEIFNIIGDIKIPLTGCRDNFANCGIGDFILIIDDGVWVRDWNNLGKEQFTQSSFSPEFVRINSTLFKKS